MSDVWSIWLVPEESEQIQCCGDIERTNNVVRSCTVPAGSLDTSDRTHRSGISKTTSGSDANAAFVHTPLDLYAFIALASSSSTVNGLIEMMRSDSDRWQQEVDRRGLNAGGRSLNLRMLSRLLLIFSLEIVPSLQLHQSRV